MSQCELGVFVWCTLEPYYFCLLVRSFAGWFERMKSLIEQQQHLLLLLELAESSGCSWATLLRYDGLDTHEADGPRLSLPVCVRMSFP